MRTILLSYVTSTDIVSLNMKVNNMDSTNAEPVYQMLRQQWGIVD